MHKITPAPGRAIHDLFRIQGGQFVDGKLPRWTFPELATQGSKP